MSAIMGIYYPQGNQVKRQNLEKMTDILSHRGIDAAGIWNENSIGFGHRMLWTTPESLGEKLPFSSRDENLTITADARIDNRAELIELLGLNHLDPETISDSQLILASYETWGESCLEKLLGDFAFAIWDRQKQSILCARDHLGIKPFYYYHCEQAFVFASEIKGLFCVPEIPCKLNQVRLGDYLALNLYDKEITFYADIFRLPPAHILKVNSEGIEITSYWSLDAEYELQLNSDEEYANKFRELFTEAVGCRLRSAYPIGSMLSGGLDSSSITCTAQKILDENKAPKLPSFSFVFNQVSESDERCFIDAVTSNAGVLPNYIYGDQISPLVEIEKLLWHQDEPLYNPDLYLSWKAYESANQLGVRILLDGFDGDNVVSFGIGYLIELARAGNGLKLLQEIHEYIKNIKGHTSIFSVPYWQEFVFCLEHYGIVFLPHRYRRIRSIWYRVKKIREKILSQFGIRKLAYSWSSSLNSKFVEKIDLLKRHQALVQARYADVSTQRKGHYQDLNRGALPAKVETLDRAAAAFNLELRYPFLDKRLVEFCLSLPAEQKMQQGWTRMILRRGMEGILPSQIQWRGSKGDLGYSFKYGLKTFEQDTLQEMLDNPSSIQDYLNLSYLEQTYQDLISETKVSNDILAIWKSINLFLWIKFFKINS